MQERQRQHIALWAEVAPMGSEFQLRGGGCHVHQQKINSFLAAIFHSEFLLQEIFEERNNNCITFSMPQSQRVIVGRAFAISAV